MSIQRMVIGCMMAIPLLAAPFVGQAAPLQINDAANFQSNDFYSWAELGDSCTQQCTQICIPFLGCGPLTCPITDYNYRGSPFTATSDGGFDAEVKNTDSLIPTDPFRRVDEGTVLCTGWRGNFTLGDHLLFTTVLSGGPISIEFDKPVQGVGTQLQRVIGGNFTASLKAYDEDDALIADFTADGTSNSNQDGSAVFLGAYDGKPSIKRIEYSIPGEPFPLPFAINQLDIARAPDCAILGDSWVVIGGNAKVEAGPSDVCTNGTLKTAAKVRIDTRLLAIGNVDLGSGTIIGSSVLTNGDLETGVQVQIGNADGPDDLDVDSGGDISFACGSGAEGICQYLGEISGCGGCGVETHDTDTPIAEAFALPACDASDLPGGEDIKTGAKSNEYTAEGGAPLMEDDYGNVIFGSGNQVELAGGSYSFLSLKFGGQTQVLVQAPITVRVQDALRFADGVEIHLAEGVTPDEVVWLVDGAAEAESEHKTGAKTVLNGTICGPNSTIVIGSGAEMTGAIFAKAVKLGPKVNFSFYPAPSVFSTD